MALAQRITSLLTSLTPAQLKALTPADAQLLSDECERVYRELGVTKIFRDAQQATKPRSGILADPHVRDTD